MGYDIQCAPIQSRQRMFTQPLQHLLQSGQAKDAAAGFPEKRTAHRRPLSLRIYLRNLPTVGNLGSKIPIQYAG